MAQKNKKSSKHLPPVEVTTLINGTLTLYCENGSFRGKDAYDMIDARRACGIVPKHG